MSDSSRRHSRQSARQTWKIEVCRARPSAAVRAILLCGGSRGKEAELGLVKGGKLVGAIGCNGRNRRSGRAAVCKVGADTIKYFGGSPRNETGPRRGLFTSRSPSALHGKANPSCAISHRWRELAGLVFGAFRGTHWQGKFSSIMESGNDFTRFIHAHDISLVRPGR
jgi:hypothetical protein